MDNPTTVADCGLPATTSRFTSTASVTTFNMTADCTYHSWSATGIQAVLHFASGEFTINGNGHSIIGPPHTIAIFAQGSSTVVNLNNLIIRQVGTALRYPISLWQGATLRGRNLIFRGNSARTALSLQHSGTRAILENVQFLDNRQSAGGIVSDGSVISTFIGPTVTITNGIFRGNRNSGSGTSVITAGGLGAAVTLMGCMTFENNVRADGSTAAVDYSTYPSGGNDGTVTDSSTGACPAGGFRFPQFPQKKSKKTATPRPSPTARPLATTCIDLNQATGIVVRATYGLASGVQCQRLGGGGIGVQAIVDGGFIDAVDIWGYVEQGVEVCFPQAGELLFLDARTMPRAIAPLAAHVVNGMTCGAVETPGSIVLMPLP